MKKRIYFVRHGETEYNNKHLIQGRGIDASLDEKGRQQAEAFYQYYNSVHFDKIYTSSLQRTHQSMAHFIADGIPHVILPGFDELFFGEMEGKPIYDANGKFALESVFSQWRKGDGDVRPEGGESPNEVLSRNLDALDEVLSHENEQNVIVCMHGRALRILISHLVGRGISNMEEMFHHNLAVSLFEYNYETTIFTPIKIADTAHLEGLSEAK